MAYKTSSNAKGLIVLETEIQSKNEEITELRRYRKRAKKAYRQLQLSHERLKSNFSSCAYLSRDYDELRRRYDELWDQANENSLR